MVALIAGQGNGSWLGDAAVTSTVEATDVIVYMYGMANSNAIIPAPSGFGATWAIVQNNASFAIAIGTNPTPGANAARTVACIPTNRDSTGSSSAWVVRGLTSTAFQYWFTTGSVGPVVQASPGRALLAAKVNNGTWPYTNSLPTLAAWAVTGNTASAIPENEDHQITISENKRIGTMLIGAPPVPDPPTSLSLANIKPSMLDLDWAPPTASNAPVPDGYEYRINSGAGTILIPSFAHITGLTPETNYTIEVRSISGNYRSAWVAIATHTPPLPLSPYNLEAVAVTHESFSVFWDDPPVVTGTGAPAAPEYYEYRLNMGARINIGLAEDVELTDLKSDTEYLFEIRSYSDGHFGYWAPLTIKTLPIYKRISWSSLNPRYHHGVDRGVLYPLEGPGVAWNGLVSVEDNHVGGEFEPIYMDGIKRLNLPSGRNYQANLSAYSTPEEFAPCNGEVAILDGFILTRQPRQRFGFSYRTMIGGDLGYQIHLVYNALATPTGRSYATKTDSPSPNVPTWVIDAVPIASSAPRPTSHYILDSTEIGVDEMETIEGLLYGTESRSAYLPGIGEIAAIATNWDPQLINPVYSTGISNLVDGMGDVQEVDVDGVYISLPNGRLTETAVKGLYQLTE